jgi:hypothetical protein
MHQETVEHDTAQTFILSVGDHPVFGALATLRLSGQAARRLTFREARHLSDALEALATGGSRERRIYMSPIASDADFEATASSEGLLVPAPTGGGALMIAWPEVRALAAALRRAAKTRPSV